MAFVVHEGYICRTTGLDNLSDRLACLEEQSRRPVTNKPKYTEVKEYVLFTA